MIHNTASIVETMLQQGLPAAAISGYLERLIDNRETEAAAPKRALEDLKAMVNEPVPYDIEGRKFMLVRPCLGALGLITKRIARMDAMKKDSDQDGDLEKTGLELTRYVDRFFEEFFDIQVEIAAIILCNGQWYVDKGPQYIISWFMRRRLERWVRRKCTKADVMFLTEFIQLSTTLGAIVKKNEILKVV